jgi:cytochrome oxidase Cu insertion factor (SCO1/SenC/PrrC family)
MRMYSLILATAVCAALPLEAMAQREKKEQEEAFVRSAPTVGEQLPDVTVYLPDGTPMRTSSLKGHYTVLTFGCLT